MTKPDIARLRLHNQRIAGDKFERPADVVSWLGAVQAQDYLGALWAVGLRMRSAIEADIEQDGVIRFGSREGKQQNSSAPKLAPSLRQQAAMGSFLTRNQSKNFRFDS